MIGKTLAWTVIILNTGACIGYLCSGNWRMVAYWGAAAILNLAVTL